jgi:hypothetical protein
MAETQMKIVMPLVLVVISLGCLACSAPPKPIRVQQRHIDKIHVQIKEVNATLKLGETKLHEAIDMLGKPNTINSGIYGNERRYVRDELYYYPLSRNTVFTLSIYTPTGLHTIRRYFPANNNKFRLIFEDGILTIIYD